MPELAGGYNAVGFSQGVISFTVTPPHLQALLHHRMCARLTHHIPAACPCIIGNLNCNSKTDGWFIQSPNMCQICMSVLSICNECSADTQGESRAQAGSS